MKPIFAISVLMLFGIAVFLPAPSSYVFAVVGTVILLSVNWKDNE